MQDTIPDLHCHVCVFKNRLFHLLDSMIRLIPGKDVIRTRNAGDRPDRNGKMCGWDFSMKKNKAANLRLATAICGRSKYEFPVMVWLTSGT
jgi:hypothetical protein